MRDGLAAVAANRREYRLVLECQIPVLALALALLHWQQKMLFCVGWTIHAAFLVFVAVNRDMAGVFLALVTHETNTES
jgi:hypothetical protein